eukprot:gene36435-44940_t
MDFENVLNLKLISPVTHVGNSRVVLSQNKIAVDLTSDHLPDDPEERARIESVGGKVDVAGGVWRVMGNLAVARSIGDRLARPYISSQADVYVRPLTAQDEFVIVATDGVWSEFSSQEAVDYVHTCLDWIASSLSTPQKLRETIETNRDRLGEGADQLSAEQLRTFLKKDIAEFLVMESFNNGCKDNLAAVIQWIDHNAAQ